MLSAVRAELGRLLEEFETADRESKSSGDAAVLAAREAAAARFWDAGTDLGDLWLLMLRYAARRQPAKAREWVAALCGDAIAEAVGAEVRRETAYLGDKMEQQRKLYDALRRDVADLNAALVELDQKPRLYEEAAHQ